MNTYMRNIKMKFCCANMMMYFREGAVQISCDYIPENNVYCYTPLVKFNDAWHVLKYCPFCGECFNVEVGDDAVRTD